jgi:NAD-dependent deacetylase
MKKKIVVLSGAGISAESGIQTFRDSNGLWENYKIEEVATPEAWRRNPKLVLDFYNLRRKNAAEAQPNKAHLALAELESRFDIEIITQNVDDLHERAGSTNVLHLHGELRKARSVANENLITDIGEKKIFLGDLASDGCQLRPHIVWFGEDVPLLDKAAFICEKADYFLIIGTSLQVYPAAGLLSYIPLSAQIFVIDPKLSDIQAINNKRVNFITKPATTGIVDFI